jgi:Mg-chelatase subunit ChlD
MSDCKSHTVDTHLDRTGYESSSSAPFAILRTVVTCPDESKALSLGILPCRSNSDLVVAVDCSGSMAGTLDSVRRSCEFLLRSWCDEPGRVAVVSFSAEAKVVRELRPVAATTVESDVDIMNASLRAEGCTNLGGGLAQGLDMFDQSPREVGRVLILISDGLATVGTTQSSRIRDTVQTHRNFAGCMVFTLAIGSECDFQLLHLLSSVSSGGSLFEISRSANPATAIGAMAGVIAYQRLRSVTVRVMGESMLAVDCSGVTHTTVGDGEVHYELGHMAAGERRSMLTKVYFPREAKLATSFKIQVFFSGVESMTGQRFTGEHCAVAMLLPPGSCSSAQDARVEVDMFAIEGLKKMFEEDVPAVRLAIGEIDDLETAHAEAAIQDADLRACLDRLCQLKTRMGWFLETGVEDTPAIGRLLRAVTTEIGVQRMTTHQATQEDLWQVFEDREGFNAPLLDVMPPLMRTFSEQATLFSESKGVNLSVKM